MWHLPGLLCLVCALIGSVGCGAGLPVPMPVQPTPTVVRQGEPPFLLPPPKEFVPGDGTGGLCGTTDISSVTLFAGHFNSSDGRHFHRWIAPDGSHFWVVC